ncbi:TonB-dependent siderophore receptor [Acinetobacter sp. ANC 3882]|uniref:TonB-dependent siderophore receptor n=1 Tax=Acinetobacter sp. ANC 3882 TaxID=2923423 RepID=UPI001F4BB948|nr:TonB-dependent siderophore receptor [Acinetobacter sp. ANC 3882]MCH7314763.1 TonB-dependent siderophore receptor [Acinetobacter sp. ANC 3882]
MQVQQGKTVLTIAIQIALLSMVHGVVVNAYAANEGQLNPKTLTGEAELVTERNPSRLPVIKVAAEPQEVGLKKQTETGALGSRSILDTPFSMAVVESEDIRKRGAKSIAQIFVNDASVYSPTSSATTDWWGAHIRGLGVRNFYADGLPMDLYWGGDFPVEAAETVTALKGLKGFMYGFGSPGGAISYSLKRPKDVPETVVDVGYRNSSLFSALLDSSDRTDMGDIGYRVVIGGEKGEAYNVAEANRFVGSLALDKKFNDQFSWNANFTYEKNKLEHEPLQFYLGRYDVTGSARKLPKVTYNYENINVDNAYYDTSTFAASTGLSWKLNESWESKYQFGYTRKEHESRKAFANLQNRNGDYSGRLYDFAGVLESYVNQVMLNGKFNTGLIGHDVVMGVGYQRSQDRYSNEMYYGNDFNGNIYQDQKFMISRQPNFSLAPKSRDESQTYGFVSDTAHFNDQWQTIFGLRYTYYDREDVDRDPTKNSGYSTKTTTPTVAILYKPTPTATLYSSYVEGLEAGSRVSEMYANVGEILKATVSKQYEMGFKYDAAPFSFSSALFKIERVEAIDRIQDGQRYLKQDGLTTYNGMELNGSYSPIDAWKLGISLIGLDATIDQVSEANQATQGNRPANASKWQGVIHTEYQLKAIEGLSVHGNVRYNGTSYASTSNDLKLPAYRIVNAGLSYKFKLSNRDAVLNANMNNVLNKKYWAGGDWGAANVGEARNGSLGLSFNW